MTHPHALKFPGEWESHAGHLRRSRSSRSHRCCACVCVWMVLTLVEETIDPVQSFQSLKTHTHTHTHTHSAGVFLLYVFAVFWSEDHPKTSQNHHEPLGSPNHVVHSIVVHPVSAPQGEAGGGLAPRRTGGRGRCRWGRCDLTERRGT